MEKYLVFDIGGSSVKFALMNKDKIFEKDKFTTPKDSLKKLVDLMKEVISHYSDQISGIALSMPGVIRPEDGYVLDGGAISYFKGSSVKALLEEETSFTVEIENDSKSAAQGELWKGNLRKAQSGVMLVLGTGVGGAIILGGEVVRGYHQGAGEISFIRTNQNNPHNVQETFGAVGSIVKMVDKAADMATSFIPKEEFTGEILFDYIRDGNEEIRAIVEAYADNLAVQIINLQGIIDPEVFIIGGGMSQQNSFIEIIQNRVQTVYDKNEIPGFEPKVLASSLGNDANLYGALYHYLKANERL